MAPVGPGKPLALIAYLAFAPRRTASRDVLCDLLWGDRELDEARTQLRQTLWLIKRQAAGITIESAADGLVLTSALAVDAEEFRIAVAANDLERAIDLYAGDFFTGYAAPGARRFEEWADLERAR